jgi:predicted metalloprotease
VKPEIIVSVCVAVVMALAVTVGYNHYENLVERAKQGEQRKETAVVTSATIGDVQATTQQRERVEVVVTQGRDTWTQTKQEEERREPTLRARSDTVVPDSVRSRARERRLARERSGNAGAGSETKPAE